MTDSVKLEPCPAGHKTVACREWPAHGPDKWHWFACCTCCGWQGPPGFRTEAEAIAAWNRRHQPQEREADLRSKLRCIISHATGGETDDPDLSLNEICVRISAFRNKLYQAGKLAALTTPAPAQEREAACLPERWEGLAGEKDCRHCRGKGWHMVTIDPDLDRHEPTPCSWCLVPRTALKTTPAPAVEPDQALLQQICDNMAEVLKPLPGEE